MKISTFTSAVLFLALSAALAMSPATQAMQLMFIKNIPGDSQVEGYTDWIVIDSVQAVVNEGDCEEVMISKRQDSASLLLIAAASSGMLLNEIEIVNLQAGKRDEPNELVETFNVKLSPAKISSISLDAASDDSLVSESISLDTGALIFSPNTPEEFAVPCGKLKK